LSFNVAEWPLNNKIATEFSYRGLVQLLPLLEEGGLKATFFVSGAFAKKEKEIVRRIAAEGHEIASYSMFNQPHKNFSPEKTYNHIKEAKKELEKIYGEAISGFRMPFFEGNRYYLGILSKLGFSYDSSSNPIITPFMHKNFLKRKRPYMIKSLDIMEIPITVSPFLKMPICSGFMRNLGNFYSLVNIEINGITKDKMIFYFYPWEFINIQKMKGSIFMTKNTGARFRWQFADYVEYLRKMHYRFDVMRNLKQ